MLLSASFHLVASLFTAIHTGNANVANMFNIIGVSLLFPTLGSGELNSFLGAFTVVAIGTCIYFILYHHYSRVGKKPE